MRFTFDIECDDLRASKIWCCCCYDPDAKAFKVFHEDTKEECKKYFEEADEVISFNGIMFDAPTLERLWDIQIPIKKHKDCIVLSRLSNPKRAEGHSLRSWGIITGTFKGEWSDWSQWSEGMEEYCKGDCLTTWAAYKKLQHELQGFSTLSQNLEYRSQWLLAKQHYNGFAFDMDGAVALKNLMQSEYFPLIQKLQQTFPPRKVLVDTYKVRRKQNGELTAKSAEIISRDYVEPTEDPDTYNVYEYKEFMIDSPAEIRERMKPYWHPVVWNKPTKDGSVTPKVCDENLETVGEDAPESIKDIVRCKILKSRSTLVQSFIDACWEDNRVHGDVISVGASSNRMAHRNPNTGNIPSGKSLYGDECRALYIAPEGKKIVGCDASGIQLRALAHYVKDAELVKQITEGDIHVHLAKVYGLLPESVQYDETIKEHKKARSTGKTITYAILMGAGATKIGQIVGGNATDGNRIMKRLASGIHGWSKLKSQIELRAQLGYFTALDGRRVALPNAHKGMSFYLQSFEQAVVKWVMWTAYQRLTKAGIDFKQVAVVHDEIQYEVPAEQAEQTGQIVQQCFKDAGEFFKTFCPLEGEYKVGNNWKESH